GTSGPIHEMWREKPERIESRRRMRAFAGAMGIALFAGAMSGCHHLAGQSETVAVSPVELAEPRMNESLTAETLDVERLSTAVFHETNQVRRRLGLRLFKRLPQLDQAADLQASANALNQFASHHNIVTAWATPFDRVRNLGLRPSLVSENAGLLSLINLDPSHGYIERITEGGPVILDASTGRVAVAHTYATYARAIVDA
ncbi:MAG TPA: hypothetical protein VL069_08060, partial [Opitutus sp.]|nr:hypothetical protein [Opitutus sp.]